MKWRFSLTISVFNVNYLPDEDRKKVDAKNEDEDEKIGRMNLIFEFSISKLGLVFMKIL